MTGPLEGICFPGTGTGPLARYGAVGLRAFGSEPRDLDLDLEAHGSGPEGVTELLAMCASPPDGGTVELADVWGLPVGRRMEALLRLAALAGDSRAQVIQSCPACEEILESEFSLVELAEASAACAEAPVEINLEGLLVRLRRPTGADLRRWGQEGANDLAMARDLCDPQVMEGLGPSWLPAIEAALDEVDPLVDFSIATTCPECQASYKAEVDLEALALVRLRAVQRKLVDAVHRLALAYHWTETEILALPSWRRERYLALIDGSWQ